jgi:hypothetical protein
MQFNLKRQTLSRDHSSSGEPAAMSATYQQQSVAQVWKRRQRRQKVLVACVIFVLLVALVYGWLHVFGLL